MDIIVAVVTVLLFGAGPGVCASLRPPERSSLVIVNVILLVLSALLMVYLVYALLRPEKF